MTGDLDQRIVETIERDGPLRFDRFMDMALYDPVDGFYTSGGAAGRRRGDFITSPEVGPLFGAVLARALDQWWVDCGRPDVFHVAEAAAGRGALARSVLAAEPQCGAALRYHLLETSPSLRAEHDDLVARDVTSNPSWPHAPSQVDVVVANELLDNLPTRIIERTKSGWAELAVDAALQEVLIDFDGEAPEVATDLPVGTRVPWTEQGIAWVGDARCRAAQRLVVIDYGAPTAELAARGPSGWLRGYRSHHRVTDVLAAPGSADITVDVPFDQLPEPTTISTQAEWLQRHGIDELTSAAAAVWETERSTGGLAAVRARSALIEAEALTDPTGLGAFIVAEWDGTA